MNLSFFRKNEITYKIRHFFHEKSHSLSINNTIVVSIKLKKKEENREI